MPPGPPSRGDTDDTARPSRPEGPAPAHLGHVHYQHYYEELRLLVQEWLTATSATPVDLPDQTWVITRHGVLLGVCTTATAAALTAGIPDVAFTPINLCLSAIEDLRALWSTDPAPHLPAREQ